MKNKTKYQICAVICAVLLGASLVLLLPHPRTYAEDNLPPREIDAESVYKFIFDMKSGNLEGAERAALAMPLSGKGAQLLHRIISHLRSDELTEEEKTFVSTIVNENDANNAIVEIEYEASKEIKTIAEDNEKVVSDAKKAVMEILGNGIRLESTGETPSDNIICLGRENMYVELDKRERFIVYMHYVCRIGERRLTEGECRERAGRFVIRNMPRRYSAVRPNAEYVCENGGCDCYVISLGDKRTWVKIRCDTGSVVLFCGYGTEL